MIKDLLTGIFTKDHECRTTIYEILEHPWVTNDGEEPVSLDLQQSEDQSADLSDSFKDFRGTNERVENQRRKWEEWVTRDQ